MPSTCKFQSPLVTIALRTVKETNYRRWEKRKHFYIRFAKTVMVMAFALQYRIVYLPSSGPFGVVDPRGCWVRLFLMHWLLE